MKKQILIVEYINKYIDKLLYERDMNISPPQPVLTGDEDFDIDIDDKEIDDDDDKFYDEIKKRQNKQLEDLINIWNQIKPEGKKFLNKNTDNKYDSKLKDKKHKDFYNVKGYCEIKFLDEYNLELPEYGVKNFNRTLKEYMFFDILHIDKDNRIIVLRTSSMRNTDMYLIISNFYSFELDIKQKGDCNLRYKNHYDGPIEKIYFEFKKIKYGKL